jgi:creatinine amidohydrolase
MTIRLSDTAWTDWASPGAPPVLAVPIGSCEQHGPHLPLDTDTRIAVAIAEGLARSCRGVVVAPALTITASGEHAAFPGTLSIGAAATEMVLTELIRSADWARGLVLVNGHGGNVEPVERAVRIAEQEGRRAISWWPRVTGGDAHAGRTETSLMLAIAPETVRPDAAAPGNTAPVGDLIDEMRTGGVAAVSRNGVLGDPTGATAAEGRRILDALVADAVARVGAWLAS